MKALRAIELTRFVVALRALQPTVLIPFTDYPNKVVGATWPATRARACVWNQRDEGREVTRSFLERRAIRKVSCFVANSGAGRDHLERTFAVPRQRITVIHNGVELAPPATNRAAWRDTLHISESTPVVLMVANLHRFKDHLTLLRAFAEVVTNLDREPVLLLAGGRGTTARLVEDTIVELGIGRHVRLLGRVDDISGLLSCADLAVHSSRREGCPNSVLEAMAAGLAVVATNIVGIREALGSDHAGLVPEGDAGALASAMIRSLRDCSARTAEGRANARRVRERFSVPRMVERWVQLLESLPTAAP
jgi:glycosyltransferase involved in cell wall biosynthesis